MIVTHLKIKNARSFLDEAEVEFGRRLSIFVGPNGGGKSTLLDAIGGTIRSKLLGSYKKENYNTPEMPNGFRLSRQNISNQHVLERHFETKSGQPQRIEIEVEASEGDVANIKLLKSAAAKLAANSSVRFQGVDFATISNWEHTGIAPGSKFTFTIGDNNLHLPETEAGKVFYEYLQNYEIISRIQHELGMEPLNVPMLYFAASRSNQGFGTNVQVSGYDHFDSMRSIESANSRNGGTFADDAMQRFALKYHQTLLEVGRSNAMTKFKQDENVAALTRHLQNLGYDWELRAINEVRAHYDFVLLKHGKPLLVQYASSGERQLLNYLISIFGLKVRNALILIDEPELHLHPIWQKTLHKLFLSLSAETQNQFVFATHSPVFISPESIQYVTRVAAKDRKSYLVRLDAHQLPNAASQLRIINSQNNEKIFFADAVVLVEGVSDRIFWERILETVSRDLVLRKEVQFVDVGGKIEIANYESILKAFQIDYVIIADLDYSEQVGTEKVKASFKIESRKLLKGTVANMNSRDGEVLSAAIDEAVEKNDSQKLKEVWPYIRDRYRRAPPEVSVRDSAELQDFVEEMKLRRVFLLAEGKLENYLPTGYSRKDLVLLIDLLHSPNFETALGHRNFGLVTGILKEVLSAVKAVS